MRVEYHRNFLKSYRARIAKNSQLDKRFKERLSLFLADPHNPLLKDHQLTGIKKQLRAFRVTGDIRVVYQREGDILTIIDIGTHTQVY